MSDQTAAQPAAADPKAPTATDIFKIRLQALLQNAVGVPISKEKAWSVFKLMINAPFMELLHRVETEGKPVVTDGKADKQIKLPLSGIGTFEIISSAVRQPKNGLDNCTEEQKAFYEAAAALGYMPRARFYPSTAIDARVQAIYELIALEEGKTVDTAVPELKPLKAAPAPAAKPAAKAAAKPAAKPAAAPAKAAAEALAEDAADDAAAEAAEASEEAAPEVEEDLDLGLDADETEGSPEEDGVETEAPAEDDDLNLDDEL